jgi:acetylserotonin N-methyltransferase
MQPDPAVVLDLLEAFRRSKVMFAAVALGVFDALAAGPKSNATLSAELKLNTDAAERLLDACVGLGLLTRTDAGYANTPAAATYLTATSPDRLTGYVNYSNAVMWPMWGKLEDAVREGTHRWQQVYGWDGPIFDHFFRTPEAKREFLMGMHGYGRIASPQVVAAFDLSRFAVLCDLGGATGHLAMAACQRYPQMRGIVFDLPPVVPVAQELIAEAGLTDRVTTVAGDFFADDLPPADLYALGRILHDWSEPKIHKLLAKVYAALPPGGGVLIAEKLLDDDKAGPRWAQMQHLNMLIVTEGKERTVGEYAALLEAAGFRDVTAGRTQAPTDGVLAVKLRRRVECRCPRPRRATMSDETDDLPRAATPFLRRVQIRGYKSIEFCDVTLEPLTLFVGRNASGKSNFLDALAFLRHIVIYGVHKAVRLHGGRDAVLNREAREPVVEIELECEYHPQLEPKPWTARYTIQVALEEEQPPRLVLERAKLRSHLGIQWTEYVVRQKRVSWHGDSYSHPLPEWPDRDRTLLSTFGGTPFLELRERLETVRVYNFHPEAMRPPRELERGGFLNRDGRNLASTIETTREIEPWAVERAGHYLNAVTRTIEFAGIQRVGEYETLRFRTTGDESHPLHEFSAASMSDGTLRAFAALIALNQTALPWGSPSLVAIEEPETSLHPDALRGLVNACDEATARTQVLLTTHSTELLDNETIQPANIRVARTTDGRTVIGPVDGVSIEIIKRQLDTLGGLERQNQLEPDEDDLARQRQLALNGRGAPA